MLWGIVYILWWSFLFANGAHMKTDSPAHPKLSGKGVNMTTQGHK